MAELPFDSLSFVLWLIWYYPGMIVIACVLCHVAGMASDDAATGISSGRTEKPDIATHSESHTELGKPKGCSKADSSVDQTRDSDEKFNSGLPSVDEQLSLEQDSAFKQGDHRRSRVKTSSGALLKIAVFWQGVQIWLLERMGRMAARARIQNGGSIFDSVVVLALCTTLVLLSTATLQERWNGARSGETATGADRGMDMKKSSPSSRLLLAAALLVLLPWYEMLTAQYSP
ncbi:hypothetical protein AYO20_05331 [Fonsecaea nubica]|uniref:Uncharacterized protein n=1 Tax=Fonsecaea nubica TaxID=856822 RepID=A0A178D2U1_9EURO|nr:hypothetical protein AYO20_05331 [Fonsecaea nubica]OAL35481.1 hypothetical protein AYO20_05331 [Fonsecaea nubica]